MSKLEGFWSYVHADDEAESGRISRLARDLEGQFALITGDSLSLFLDKDGLKWGFDWRGTIDTRLDSIAFFIAVVTPRYLQSPECRRELTYFARHARDLGVKEILLPIHYVDVPQLRQEGVTDDLISLLQTFQWEDWRELRFSESQSDGYRRAVAKLASYLAEVNQRAESAPAPMPIQMETDALPDDDAPGLLDRLAMAEETFPAITATMSEITEQILVVGVAFKQATAELPAKGTYANLLRVSTALSEKLAAPAERISSLSETLTRQFHDADDGVRAIIENSRRETGSPQSVRQEEHELFNLIQDLSRTVHESLGQSKNMIDSLSKLESSSRHLRPVVRTLRDGLRRLSEVHRISDEWSTMIDIARSG